LAATRLRRRGGGRAATGQHGQALVETALTVPLLLLLAFAVIATGRVVQARMGVAAVAREAARAGASVGTPDDALASATSRGRQVADGYGLTNGTLQLAVDAGAFARGDRVRAEARYVVKLADLPLLGWAQVTVEGRQAERIDLYRSRWPSGGGS
jgi:Flp pilus assembly protein TadG